MLEWPVIELRERIQYLNLEGVHDHLRIAVGARRRLRNYGLHDSKVKAVSGGKLQLGSDLLGLQDIAVQNGRRALRGNHLIDGVLEHHDMISERQYHGSSAGALPNDGSDRGDGQVTHRRQAMSQRPGYPMPLALRTRIGSNRIDERDHGAAQLASQFHHPDRLAEALGLRSSDQRLAVAIFRSALLANKHHYSTVNPSQASYHGGIIPIAAIAVQFQEAWRQVADILRGGGAVGVAR